MKGLDLLEKAFGSTKTKPFRREHSDRVVRRKKDFTLFVWETRYGKEIFDERHPEGAEG